MTSKHVTNAPRKGAPIAVKALRGVDISQFEHRPSGPTKSAMIRALASQGMNASEIARTLDIPYQFAWNVMKAPVTTRKPGRPVKRRPNA
jgi:hypothetical protein